MLFRILPFLQCVKQPFVYIDLQNFTDQRAQQMKLLILNCTNKSSAITAETWMSLVRVVGMSKRYYFQLFKSTLHELQKDENSNARIDMIKQTPSLLFISLCVQCCFKGIPHLHLMKMVERSSKSAELRSLIRSF